MLVQSLTRTLIVHCYRPAYCVILFAAKHLNVPTNDYQDKIQVFWD